MRGSIAYAFAREASSALRLSSSVVIARPRSVDKDGFDYSVCMVKRSAKSSFMASQVVFPGGMVEKTDGTVAKHFGYTESDALKVGALREVHCIASLYYPHWPISVKFPSRPTFFQDLRRSWSSSMW